jgi:mRNA-degrading endonuclease toxin of MazEF toxin-antitoxin module
MEIRRWRICDLCLDPVFGRELGGFKSRPAVVVSIDDLLGTRIVTVVPGTSTPPRRFLKNVVHVQPDTQNGLKVPTFFQCHQIRAVEKGRILSSAGLLSQADRRKVEDSLRYCLGLVTE